MRVLLQHGMGRFQETFFDIHLWAFYWVAAIGQANRDILWKLALA